MSRYIESGISVECKTGENLQKFYTLLKNAGYSMHGMGQWYDDKNGEAFFWVKLTFFDDNVPYKFNHMTRRET